MQIIGLTGGIACGKSNISATMQELGAVIIDGDLLSRELTAPGGAALPEIRACFGDGVFHPDGTLDRRALGAAVFGNADNLAVLDSIMQPLLRQLILQRIEEARADKAAVCVLDMPLLYEKELDKLCSQVWCAYVPYQIQLERLMERDGFSLAEAKARIRSQLSAEEKKRRADVIIDTSGPIQYTKECVIQRYSHAFSSR